jgi:hypothetical protein
VVTIPKIHTHYDAECRAEAMMLNWFRQTGGDVIAWLLWGFYTWCLKREGKSKVFWLFTTVLAYAVMIVGWGLCIFLFYYVYMR